MPKKFPLMRNNILREDLDSVIEHLKQQDPILTNGAMVRRFEKEWSEWLGVKHSVFVNSGSSANFLTMAILKIYNPQGGEVIVPSLTWVSDIASVMQNGFNPIFVDIDPKTLCMDSKQVLSKISPKTRAVFLTHTQGFNGLNDELLNGLNERGVPLIEDVCESHGATHNGNKCGSFGWISNFSFYYAHHMSTIEGGMVCTNDDIVYQQLRMLRSHGMTREVNDTSIRQKYSRDYPQLNPDFIFAYPGYNMRNTEIGGILGLSQLKRLDKNIKRRNQNFQRFLKNIDPSKYRNDFTLEGSSNYAFNLVLKETNDTFVTKLISKMNDAEVEFRRGSAGGGNQLRQPYLKDIVPDDYFRYFPEVEHIHFYGFYIGNFPDLEDNEIDTICDIVNSVD